MEKTGKYTYFTDGLDFTLEIPIFWETIYKGKPRERLYQEYIQMLNVVKKLPKDKIIVDIGANFGLFSVPTSLLGYKVVGFEPVKSNHECLTKNMIGNSCKNFELYQYAALDKDGEAIIFIPECPDNASLNKDACVANMIGKSYVEEVVKTVKLDTFLTEKYLFNNIGLVKVDVQGSEYAVFLGAKELLSQSKNIYLIVEFEPHLLKMGVTYEELHNLILSFGFGQIGIIANDRVYYKA